MAYVKPKEHYTEKDEIEAAIKSTMSKEMQEFGSKYQHAVTCSPEHHARRIKCQTALISTCNIHKEELGPTAELVPDTVIPGRLVPRLFKDLSGTNPTQSQCLICGIVLFYSIFVKKSLRAEEGQCPFWEPTTIMTFLRTTCAIMKEDYGWDYIL